MSYLSKTQSSDNGNIIWPGFVDVLASTLMVIIFIVLLFTVAQVYLGDLVVGKNEQIQSLEKTIVIQDETIVEQDVTLTDKEIELIDRQNLIEKLDEEISIKQSQILAQDTIIQDQALDIDKLNTIIAKITDELSLSLADRETLQQNLSELNKQQEKLKSDFLLIIDGPRHPSNKPTLTFGARGISRITLKSYGPIKPQHSGHFGNYAPNPAMNLSKILSEENINEVVINSDVVKGKGKPMVAYSKKKTDLETAQKLAVEMFMTLKKEGGLGLSANQIGEDKSVCVVDVTNPFFLLNPVITKKQKEIIYKEGCLSIPNKMITTKRYERIEVEADNVEGTMIFGPEKDNQVDNDLLILEAVCVQHEIDHLNGKTIYDREFKRESFRRTEVKIGRNEKVIIKKDKETLTMKYKKAIPYLEKGWVINGH